MPSISNILVDKRLWGTFSVQAIFLSAAKLKFMDMNRFTQLITRLLKMSNPSNLYLCSENKPGKFILIPAGETCLEFDLTCLMLTRLRSVHVFTLWDLRIILTNMYYSWRLPLSWLS